MNRMSAIPSGVADIRFTALPQGSAFESGRPVRCFRARFLQPLRLVPETRCKSRIRFSDMNPSELEDRLFSLLRAALWRRPDELSGFGPCDPAAWERLCALAARQGVAALVWEVLPFLPEDRRPPMPLRLRWALRVGAVESRWRRQRRTLARLAAFYARHDIPMMVLKGCGLSRFYPVPEHRPCGDIDIWLFGHRAEGDERMAREWGIRIAAEPGHHTTFRIDGIPVENHNDFVHPGRYASNARYEARLARRAAEPGGCLELGGARVCLPSATFDALFLMRHMAVHFVLSGITVRHLTDWALFVAGSRSRIDWTEFRTAVREAGMQPFADCVQALCVDCLGMEPAWVPPFRRHAALERRMLDDVLDFRTPEPPPEGLLRGGWFRLRRWWAQRWKHRMVYAESLTGTLLRLSWRWLTRHSRRFRRFRRFRGSRPAPPDPPPKKTKPGTLAPGP